MLIVTILITYHTSNGREGTRTLTGIKTQTITSCSCMPIPAHAHIQLSICKSHLFFQYYTSEGVYFARKNFQIFLFFHLFYLIHILNDN